MRQYQRYREIENIIFQFLIFSCPNRLRKPDGAQVRPGNLLDDEEWEADYYDLKRSSMNKYGSPRVESR
jgi:hypothetical protein